MKPTRSVLGLMFLVLLCFSSFSAAEQLSKLSLGDSEAVMLKKMKQAGARNVTGKTRSTLYQAISGEQKYYWWEMPDKAIVGVLLAGNTKRSVKVVTIEVGEPQRGVAGIEHWRTQNLRRMSSVPDKSLPPSD